VGLEVDGALPPCGSHSSPMSARVRTACRRPAYRAGDHPKDLRARTGAPCSELQRRQFGAQTPWVWQAPLRDGGA